MGKELSRCLIKWLEKFGEALCLEQNKNNQSRRKDELILLLQVHTEGT